MSPEEIVSYFNKMVEENPDMSEAVAAIQTLIEYIKHNPAGTLAELRQSLVAAIDLLTQTDHGLITSISSGCDLFLRFITLHRDLDSHDFQECKKILVDRGNTFLKRLAGSRKKIAGFAQRFIMDGATVLTHSRSRVVIQVLKEAMEAKKHFTVYVTETSPGGEGTQTFNDLTKLGIPTVVILDSAVGYIMEKVDLVLVGAEGVVESGGIINKVGTYTMAISAKHMNKPFYVVAESFKFARLYPLNQQDVPNQFKYQASKLKSQEVDLTKEHPMVDYTPPALITLLFTDLGTLTPSAVSDELIKLYL